MLPFASTSAICSELKLDNPIDLVSPFSTNFSMANQVVVGWISVSYFTVPSSFLGNMLSPL